MIVDNFTGLHHSQKFYCQLFLITKLIQTDLILLERNSSKIKINIIKIYFLTFYSTSEFVKPSLLFWRYHRNGTQQF